MTIKLHDDKTLSPNADKCCRQVGKTYGKVAEIGGKT